MLEAEGVHQHFHLSHGVLIVNAIKIDPTATCPVGSSWKAL